MIRGASVPVSQTRPINPQTSSNPIRQPSNAGDENVRLSLPTYQQSQEKRRSSSRHAA